MPIHQFSYPDPMPLSTFITDIPAVLCYHPREKLIMALSEEAPFEKSGPLLVRQLELKPGEAHRNIVEAVSMFAPDFPRVHVFFISARWEVDQCGIDVECLRDDLTAVGAVPGLVAGTPAIRGGEALTDSGGAVVCRLGDPVVGRAGRALGEVGEIICLDEFEMFNRFRAGEFDDVDAGRSVQAEVEREGLRIDRNERSTEEKLQRRRAWIQDWEGCIDQMVDGRESVMDLLADRAILRTVARTFCDLTVRDMTFHMVVDSRRAEAMRTIWLHAARCFSGTYRANALACYALDREANGCTGLAVAALKEAGNECPGHSLTQLLEGAISAGCGSMAVGTMVEASLEIAEAIWSED